jgi:hypothetical protein
MYIHVKWMLRIYPETFERAGILRSQIFNNISRNFGSVCPFRRLSFDIYVEARDGGATWQNNTNLMGT